MRLIDADAFLERFEAMCDTKTDSVIAMVLRGALVDEPTAYDVDSVVQQIKTLSPANYVSKDDVLKIVKCDKFSPKSEKNSFFDFDEVLRIECEKARSKAIDDFSERIKQVTYTSGTESDGYYKIHAVCERDIDEIAEQLKKEVEE